MSEDFLNGRITLHCGDCLDVLATLPENSIDSCVTDPPYLLTSIVKRFGQDGAAPAQFGNDGRFSRLSGGFMNQKWDAPTDAMGVSVFEAWLAGFIAGEGCFRIQSHKDGKYYTCQFSIHLRQDDAAILIACQKRIGGRIIFQNERENKQGIKSKPDIRWIIETRGDCLALANILDRVPLFAKKAKDYELWRRGLDLWVNTPKGSRWHGPRDVTELAILHKRLQNIKRWDGVSEIDLNFDPFMRPDQAFHYRWAKEVYRVLKPGAHLLAFGGTRTQHRMVCAIEDAGFEIRDTILYLFGSGFPKSHDVSKGIDRAAGAERQVVGKRSDGRYAYEFSDETKWHGQDGFGNGTKGVLTAPATDAARQWQGWGTALKPACEPIVLARKPLSEKNVAANVLRWGTGAINVDGCRVETSDALNGGTYSDGAAELSRVSQVPGNGIGREFIQPSGRWPANVIHDGSDEVVGAFPTEAGASGPVKRQSVGSGFIANAAGNYDFPFHKDSGSAARFFKEIKQDGVRLIESDGWYYIADRDGIFDGPWRYKWEAGEFAKFCENKRLFYTSKANADDRLGSKHPTVKPLDLMQYLVRLVTPKGGTVLDLFAGTGTTGEAAWREGMNALLIERESEYQGDIRRRMALCLSGVDERQRESVKAKLKDKPLNHGPLFGGV